MENREIKDITQELREIKYATESTAKRLEDILKTLKEPTGDTGLGFIFLILIVLVVIVGVATWHFW